MLMAAILLAAAVAQAAPRYHCAEPVFDFGTLPAGETVRHGFRIENRGETDLTIERVRSCCGAAAAVEAKTVPPGSHTLFRVVLPLRRPAPRTTKTFYLHTDDPGNRIVPLRLEGAIGPGQPGEAGAGEPPTAEAALVRRETERQLEAGLRFDPPVLDFGRVPAGREVSATAEIAAGRDRVRLLDAYARDGRLGAKLETAESGETGRLTVTTAADMPPGRFEGAVTVVYRDFGVKRTEYRVRGERVEFRDRRAVVEFFFEAGCRECDEVERRILPGLAARMPDACELRRLDIGTPANYIRLVAYQKRFGIESNEAVSMVVNGRRMLDGLRAIRDDLVPAVAEALADAREPDIPDDSDLAAGMAGLRDRAQSFTVWAVVVAGLTDGINPCAITALVFFLSLLAVFKVTGRTLLLTGAAFCLASFLTYTAIGFGLLRALHAFRGFPAVRTGIERVMVGLLAVFAVLSFVDAWRFARSGKAGDVTLKLPERLQRKVHGIMRSGLGTRRPVLAGFGIGAAVTVIESVCTGQVYVPTLTLIARDDPGSLRAWGLLLLYNAMFVVPLIVAFVLTRFGLRTETLVAWSRRHVVFGKVLLGLFFAAMAALLLVL